MTQAQSSAARPALSPVGELVTLVWNFCGGWNPAVIPVALAYYDVEDPELVIAGMMAIRDRLAAHDAATRAAQAKK